MHTEVGHHTIGGRVNGRLVPLESTLENGDVVEVLTSKADGAGPSRDWLLFVKSARARNKIRQWFSKERREEAIERGKDSIAKAMRQQNLPCSGSCRPRALHGGRGRLRYVDIDACTRRWEGPRLRGPRRRARVVASFGGEEGASEDIAEATAPTRPSRTRRAGDPGVRGRAWTTCWVKLPDVHAGSGRPDPWVRTRGNGVSVHRRDCTNAESLLARTIGSSTSSGRRVRRACSSSSSRSRRSTATGC